MRDLLRLCAFALAIAGFAAPAVSRTPGEVQIGGTLRDATLQGLNGRARNLLEFRGRPLIINVWASWCGPCRLEMASLERLAWLDSAKHFTIIGISTDDDRGKAVEYLENSHATISHFIDSQLRVENMLGAERLPLTVLVDAKGRVLEKVYGAQRWDGPEALALIGKSFGIRMSAPVAERSAASTGSMPRAAVGRIRNWRCDPGRAGVRSRAERAFSRGTSAPGSRPRRSQSNSRP